jgi:benzoyl-CoA reductase/2-hydroxyglutaryl-CoA dehydratase subunit BcrC/BadD/HgdB
VTTLHIDIEHFKARLLQDALTEATAQYWIHRANQFQQAAPRLNEYHGQASDEQLRDAWLDCMATAEACRRHAKLTRPESPEPISTEVTTVMAEVA